MVTQVLVYVGGILILILFGVMFTQRIYDRRGRSRLVQAPSCGIARRCRFRNSGGREPRP
jgi:NADH:ubiquinone oxidoreductase subunit 6 (subunit J)